MAARAPLGWPSSKATTLASAVVLGVAFYGCTKLGSGSESPIQRPTPVEPVSNEQAAQPAPSAPPLSEVQGSDEKGPTEIECPPEQAEQTESGPFMVLDDLAEMLPVISMDYMERYGEMKTLGDDLPTDVARDAVCSVFQDGYWTVLDELRLGKFAPKGERCAGQDKLETSMGRFSYEVQLLPNGKYLAVRTAEMPGGGGSPHYVRGRVQGGVIVVEAVTESFRCPNDREEPCVLRDDAGGAGRVCIESAEACVRSGYTSVVHVTDARGDVTLEFGLFEDTDIPTVTVDDARIEVVAGQCSQVGVLGAATQ